MAEVAVRRAGVDDAPAIARIYNDYVLGATCTFDTEPKTAEERVEWLDAHDDAHPVLVACRNEVVLAWGSLSRWSQRPAWGRTVEVGTYVARGHEGQGLGRALMEALLVAGHDAGHHVAIAQIVVGNDASVGLVERFGFERVGTLREVGRKFDRWLDVLLYQRML